MIIFNFLKPLVTNYVNRDIQRQLVTFLAFSWKKGSLRHPCFNILKQVKRQLQDNCRYWSKSSFRVQERQYPQFTETDSFKLWLPLSPVGPIWFLKGSFHLPVHEKEVIWKVILLCSKYELQGKKGDRFVIKIILPVCLKFLNGFHLMLACVERSLFHTEISFPWVDQSTGAWTVSRKLNQIFFLNSTSSFSFFRLKLNQPSSFYVKQHQNWWPLEHLFF